ncbi:MAG: NADH-quinone oxidoreductase subunit A [Thermoplasmatota archaeon]
MADSVLNSYAPVAFTAILGFIIVWVTLSLTKLIAPKRNVPGKLATYESGEVPLGRARGPIDVQYYLFVLVFLVIDVEAVFLIPFALHYSELTAFQLGAVVVFVLLVLEGWVYAWKKGALDWQK